MVDAYVTALGPLTLAVDAERFLLESTASNSVLSLHPALTPAERSHPIPYDAVAGFSTDDNRLQVEWRPVEGVAASSTLEFDHPGRLIFSVSFTNVSDRTLGVGGAHLLHIPAEGPGACAIGASEARTVASRRPGARMRLMELSGEPLLAEDVAAWFASDGSPMILLGARERAERPLRFEFHAARGKVLSLRIDAPLDAPYSLEPGETVHAPALTLAVGDMDIREELAAWGERFEGAKPEFLNGFDPAAEIEEEPEEEEPGPADEEEAGASEEEEPGPAEEEKEPRPAEEEEEPRPAEEEEEPVAEEEPEYEEEELEVDEPDESGQSDGESEAGESEPAPSREESDEDAVRAVPPSSPASPPPSKPLTGVAEFRRAWRRAEGVYCRWAAGRSHAPLTGSEARARRLRRSK